MALLVRPGEKENTTVVDSKAEYAVLLGCRNVERWPLAYQLDSVEGPSGRKFRFEIWVDEEGLLRGARAILCATLAAHPLNEFRGRIIHGPALLTPIAKGAAFTLKDWEEICQGVWSLDVGSDEDDGGESSEEEDPVDILMGKTREEKSSRRQAREELVERNSKGQSAAARNG